MKNSAFITLVLLSISCGFTTDNGMNNKEELKNKETNMIFSTLDTTISKDMYYQREVMLEKDILFNGLLQRYFTIEDFKNIFGEADSTKLMQEEQPCSYIFENEDGTKDLKDRYFYKNGCIFENSNEKVAVSEFRFQKGNFILYKHLKIDSESTVDDLRKIFPQAINNIRSDSHADENDLQSIILQEDIEGTSDGHIRIFFKNSKIYSLWWWFPC